MDIKQYDTVKDKNGKRFRITEVKNDGAGHIIATLKGINPDGSARRGMPRKVGLEVLERDYTRINLAPVEVKKIDDLREEETKVTQVPTPSQKALEKQKEAVRVLSEKDVEEAVKRATFGAVQLPESDKRVKGLEENINILRTECIDLRNENRRLKESIDETNGQLRVRERELDEMKKTVSKMKYAHEEEVRALEDELAELKILAKKGGEYSDRLADDAELFLKVRKIAKAIVGMSDSIMDMAYMINDETEGRI